MNMNQLKLTHVSCSLNGYLTTTCGQRIVPTVHYYVHISVLPEIGLRRVDNEIHSIKKPCPSQVIQVVAKVIKGQRAKGWQMAHFVFRLDHKRHIRSPKGHSALR